MSRIETHSPARLDGSRLVHATRVSTASDRRLWTLCGRVVTSTTELLPVETETTCARCVAVIADSRRRVRVTLNEDELILLYALAGRECSECVLDHIGGGIAGPHTEHRPAARTALMKLSDAVLELQEGGADRG